METFNGKKFALLLIVVLVCLGLTACAIKGVPTGNPKLPDTVEQPPVEQPNESAPQTVLDSVGKMEGVANALVCMFAPDTCDTVKQEREMDR